MPDTSPDRPSWTEAERLAALRDYEILDTEPERAFDDIVDLVATLFDAPIAVVNLIDEGRQWFKAEKGLGVRETPLETSFCAHAILQADHMVVPDATQDPRFACNPLVTEAPGLRFYAGQLLKSAEGLPLGTLCVLDTRARAEGPSDIQMKTLEVLAAQVMTQLNLRRALKQQQRSEAEFRAITDSLPQ
ncbi:MAG TPA: histidine kinase, partial [Brevundimonas sp.]|nr:histidine kinase [Brevundimonas sp.]